MSDDERQELRMDEIQAAHEKVTPGPWSTARVQGHDGALHYMLVGPDDGAAPGPIAKVDTIRHATRDGELVGSMHENVCAADATFIAKSRTWIPQLVDEVRDLQRAVRHLRERGKWINGDGHAMNCTSPAKTCNCGLDEILDRPAVRRALESGNE